MLYSLKQFLKDTVKRYGVKGNRSLEYIGLVFQNGVLTGTKVYHTSAHGNRIAEKWEKDIWDKYFQKMSMQYPIHICDVSKGENEKIPSYRMVVSLKEKLSTFQVKEMLETYFDYVPGNVKERFFNHLQNLSEKSVSLLSPLMQVGVEVNSANQYIGLKYYIELPISDNNCSLFQWAREFANKAEAKKITEIINLLQGCNYLPCFVGINDNGVTCESKLYFVSKLYGHSLPQDAKLQITSLCEILNLENEVCDFFQSVLEDEGIYPKGIALSFNEEQIIRLYLKSHALIKSK